MRKSIVVAFGGAVTALMAACGTNGEGGGQNPDPSASTSTTTPSPVVPPTTVTPGTNTPPSANPPVTPPSVQPSTPPPTPTGASGTTGGTNSDTGATADTTSGGDTASTSETPAAGSTGGGETSEPPGPIGPPAGAYEKCSGTPFPKVVLTEFLTSPKVALPIDMDFPPGQPGMVYVTERGGKVKRFALDASGNVTGNATEILSVTTSTQNECGLLGVAFHPDFDGQEEKRFYVSYMPACPQSIFSAGGKSALEEWEINGDTATKTEDVFTIDQPQGNHNGGNVQFGPDGYLYYGLGDGGNSDDQGSGHSANGNGQDVTEPLGSMLRYDVEDLATPPTGNLTPGDVGGEDVDERILHFGLRNPWRFSFDRLTGDLYIGDVGQDTREEVDMVPAGSSPTNFGWAAREGKGAHPKGTFTLVGGTTAHEPLYDYATNNGGGSLFKGSVIGGYVYRGQKIPGMWGRYIFGEYVRGTIFSLTAQSPTEACDVIYGDTLADGAINNNQIAAQDMSSFAEDASGELYVMGLQGGIFRLDPGE